VKTGFKVSIAGLCILSVILLGVYISGKFTKNDTPTTQTYRSMAMASLKMSDEERESYFKEWGAPRKDCYLSAEEASKALPFTLKLPNTKITGKLQGIYVDRTPNSEERQAFVRFEGGFKNVYMRVTKDPIKPDFEALVAQKVQDMKEGIACNDKPPKVMDLNGIPAWTIEPGYNIIGDQKFPRPGVVVWWDSGVTYTLYGTRGEKGTSLERLMEIARSVLGNNVQVGETSPLEPSQITGVQIDKEDNPNDLSGGDKKGLIEYEK